MMDDRGISIWAGGGKLLITRRGGPCSFIPRGGSQRLGPHEVNSVVRGLGMDLKWLLYQPQWTSPLHYLHHIQLPPLQVPWSPSQSQTPPTPNRRNLEYTPPPPLLLTYKKKEPRSVLASLKAARWFPPSTELHSSQAGAARPTALTFPVIGVAQVQRLALILKKKVAKKKELFSDSFSWLFVSSVRFQHGGVCICLCLVTNQFVTFYIPDFLSGQEAPVAP